MSSGLLELDVSSKLVKKNKNNDTGARTTKGDVLIPFLLLQLHSITYKASIHM